MADRVLTFGQWLRTARMRVGCESQEQLASLLASRNCAVTKNAISLWETDQYRPSRAVFEVLIETFGADPDRKVYELYSRVSERKPRRNRTA